jgi:hypothetical protein
MKITESKLRQIIREELEQDLEEGLWDSIKTAGKAVKDMGKSAVSKVTGKEKEYIKLVEEFIVALRKQKSKLFPSIGPEFFIVANRSQTAYYPAGKLTLSLPPIPHTGSIKPPETIELNLPIKISSPAEMRLGTTIANDSSGSNIPKDKKEKAIMTATDALRKQLPYRVSQSIAKAILSSTRRWFENAAGMDMPDEVGQKFNKLLLSDEFIKDLQTSWEQKLEGVYAPLAKELISPDMDKLNQNGLDGLFAVNLAGKTKAIKS